MARLVRFVVYYVAKFVLGLRYRVKVEGLDELEPSPHGTLLIPNHPGLVDPPLVILTTWKKFQPRPTVSAHYSGSRLVGWFIGLANPIIVPKMEGSSANSRENAALSVQRAIEGLKKGETHLLYPAGRIWRNGYEKLGAARAFADILAAAPDVQVVMLRTHGLWGSRFTFARTGVMPSLVNGLIFGFFTILSNLIFFVPKRRVTMTFEKLDRSKLPTPIVRETVNPMLEEWYNRPGREIPTHVPYHVWFGSPDYQFPPLRASMDINLDLIKPDVRAVVNEMMLEKSGRELPEADINPDSTLDDLGFDSLDRMDLATEIEQRFGFRGDQVPMTVGEAWALAQGMTVGTVPPPPPARWFKRIPNGDKPVEILGDNIPQAFVARALADKKRTIVADDNSGSLNYERLLIGALVMSKRVQKIAAPNVGLMMPATVGGDVAFLAIHLAGKLPVVLNWTTGPGNLRHSIEKMQLTHILTSRRFVDRAHIKIEGAEPLFLEDLRGGVRKSELIATLLRVRYTGAGIKQNIPNPDPDSPAVVLFTSGSEKAPKAVPLTHRNVISNIRSAVEAISITQSDTLLGFLPAFHSFGLTVTMLMPILGGARLVQHPDPTDSGGLLRKIETYKPTLLASTPTFLSYILDRVTGDELASLRLAVTGAEKCPMQVFERFEALCPTGMIIEGYGITECSPVVAANTLRHNRRGSVGRALPGVELRLVDPDTHAPLPMTEQGMLLVHGPNVFPGYIGHDGPSPFLELDGKKWYVTGDLVRIDDDGFIQFAGRLKRFIKAGGEMISLPQIEDVFVRAYPVGENGPQVAVEGLELPDGTTKIVLFATTEITKSHANKLLAAEGLRGIMRIDEVRQIEGVPVLGTGKTDYKVLRHWITNPPTPEPVMAQPESSDFSA